MPLSGCVYCPLQFCPTTSAEHLGVIVRYVSGRKEADDPRSTSAKRISMGTAQVAEVDFFFFKENDVVFEPMQILRFHILSYKYES